MESPVTTIRESRRDRGFLRMTMSTSQSNAFRKCMKCLASSELVRRYGLAQSCQTRPLTRENSLTLDVTNVSRSRSACPATSRS